nr:ABC transporter I family member 6, chloroplastic [Tanacetum cinerariifolium]
MALLNQFRCSSPSPIISLKKQQSTTTSGSNSFTFPRRKYPSLTAALAPESTVDSNKNKKLVLEVKDLTAVIAETGKEILNGVNLSIYEGEEDFMYQPDNRDISLTRKEHMPYPRSTKVIITHFISKDKIISIKNIINLHNIHDDSLLGSLKLVSKTKDYQKYGALILDGMINQDIKDSKAFKTCYDVSTGKATLKKARKFKKVVSPSNKLPLVLEEGPTKKFKRVKIPAKKSTSMPNVGVVIRDTLGVSVSKKKAPAKDDIGKEIELVSNVTLLEVAQLKKGDSEDDEEDYDDNEDDSANDNDDGDETHDSVRTDSDDVKNPSFTLKDDEE